MKDPSQKALRRGHNEGNIRRRTDGRWEVRLSAGIDYKTGKPRRTSTCCNTRQEAIAVLQQQGHEVRTQGWRDPMSVTLGEWYEYWLNTYMKDTVKQSTYASYRSYLNKHFCVLGKILLKKLEPHTLQEFYNYKFREEGLSPKTLRNYHMALHKCLQQAVKERLLIYNPCDAVTLPSGEKPEIVVFTNDQQRALVQASYRHRYGVFIRLDLCTGLRMGELLALKWEDIDFSTAQLHVRRTINRLAKYEAHDGENKTEIVFGTPKTKNSRRTIGLRVNRQCRQPFQPCHRIVVAGTAVSVENLLFFHAQCHNDFLHFFAAEPCAPHDKLVSCPPFCLQAAPARNFSRRIGLFGALDFCPGVTSPEAIPLAAGHSIFKVLCLSARTSLPKKEALSRISKTSEKRLKSAYFHAYGIVL